MDKWRAPLEVYDDVMKTDWTTITLADACKVTDVDIVEVIGEHGMPTPRLVLALPCRIDGWESVKSRVQRGTWQETFREE